MNTVSQAIWISIGLGLVVQVIALLIARSYPPERILIGWGIGAGLRLVTLCVHALAIVPILNLPLVPSLVALAGVFFVTMLVEPFLLNSRGSGTQMPPIDK